MPNSLFHLYRYQQRLFCTADPLLNGSDRKNYSPTYRVQTIPAPANISDAGSLSSFFGRGYYS